MQRRYGSRHGGWRGTDYKKGGYGYGKAAEAAGNRVGCGGRCLPSFFYLGGDAGIYYACQDDFNYRRGAGRRCWNRGYGGGQGNGAGMGGYFSLLRMDRIYDGGMVPAADIGK